MKKLINNLSTSKNLLVRFFILMTFMMIIMKCGPQQEVRITGRDFLLDSENEEPGYGLYSYAILLKKPDSEIELNRYLNFYTEFYSCLQPSESYIRRGVRKYELNITYWPLQDVKKIQVSKENSDLNWNFFIDKYDYTRARIILSRIEKLDGIGPFIIGYNEPLTLDNKELSLEREEMLLIDFSTKNEDFFDDMMLFYQKKVAENPETWNKKWDKELIRIECRSTLKTQAENVIKFIKFLEIFWRSIKGKVAE